MSREPKQCPVCGGRGMVPSGFYDTLQTSSINEVCRTCAGSGIVWEPEQNTETVFYKNQ